MKKKYEDAVMAYVNAFAEKHDYDFDGWVGDFFGEVACFGDYFVNFFDIKLDIDTKQHVSKFAEWYSSDKVNYRTFIRLI